MADLDLEGNPVPKKEVKVDSKPVEGEMRETKNMIQLNPSQAGNELVVMVKMLEGINRNLALLATTIYNHLNGVKKNG